MKKHAFWDTRPVPKLREKFETDNPNIFNGMYQFWLKKN